MIELNLPNNSASQTTKQYNSMCRFGNIFLGATDSGIENITGYTDNLVSIPAMIRSGKFDLGSERMKRFRFFYFGLKSSGGLVLSVWCDDILAESYDVENTSSPMTMEIRVPISRKIQGRYWEWKVENVNGSFFSLYSVKALPVFI
jgi:hypothetical protein